jgi:hypothetical protein
VLAKSALPNRLRLAACPQAPERGQAQYMPNLDQRRWIVVTIVVSLGCTQSDDTPWAAQPPEAPEQVPSGLIAFVSDRDGSDALFVMRSDGRGYDVSPLICQPCPTPPGRRTGSGWHSMPDRPPPVTST